MAVQERRLRYLRRVLRAKKVPLWQKITILLRQKISEEKSFLSFFE
jgi:hypothetical protein